MTSRGGMGVGRGGSGRRMPAAELGLAFLAGVALMGPSRAAPLQAAPLRAAATPLWVGDTRQQLEAKLSLAQQPPAGETLVRLARQLLGRPYNAFSLDQEPQERLRLDLTAFDCALLVEQLLAMVHSRSVTDFSQQVRRLRYGDGPVDYCTRNHYFTIWARNAERLGLVKDITASLPGATSRGRRLLFMSSHPNSYRPMRQPRARQCITALERDLIVKQSYIPIRALGGVAAQLRSGDIFALVTAVDGLDVTHTGFLERSGSGLHAIHAAPKRGVIRSSDFVRYAASVEDVVGISILRPQPAASTKR
ncbi:MAG: N-acetylmuramoyl-L-alanine amidase-like domain-containing protein [Synechococcaceae cyanobacterium]|nr:N-acetylmuramoyl-L-alanine amidase-like domain-containing protein [Synechococcaceae cyanobacterium]